MTPRRPAALAALLLAATGGLALSGPAPAPTAAPDIARGKQALTQTAFIPAFWPEGAYENAWRNWGETAKPADFAERFRDRYGLAEAPYPNHGLPMGLRPAGLLFGKGIGIDCMTCHGGSVAGTSYVGLGNSSLDIQALFTELGQAPKSHAATPFRFGHTRGTNEAGAFSVYLLGLRNPDLTLSAAPKNLGLRDDSVEDVPAWWLLKKKRTMYHTGTTDADSVRSLMQFLMHPLTTSDAFPKYEPAFRDIQAYIKSIEAPKYPLPIDRALAERGRTLFEGTCAKCHGEYAAGPGGEWSYPNRIIEIEKIGTDRKRYDNIRQTFAAAYNASWFAQDDHPVRDTAGYQAPPLDGIWATAPYLHNGSVPTLTALLDSKSRPAKFRRSFRTDLSEYDAANVGWKVTPVESIDPNSPANERRKVYDTTRPGHGNGGHTYGDDLSPEERAAVVEYLKTL